MSDNFDALLDEFDLDYLFIDTHPGLNKKSMLAATLSDVLIIQTRPDQEDYYGTAVLTEIAAKLDANGSIVRHVHSTLNRPLRAEDKYDIVVAQPFPVLLAQTPACASRWRWIRAKDLPTRCSRKTSRRTTWRSHEPSVIPQIDSRCASSP